MSSRGSPPAPADGTGEPVRVVIVPGADAALAARLLPLLSDVERARAAGIRAGGVRIDFVVARAVLRDELGRVLGCDPAELPVGATSTGKPVLSGGVGPELGVTHTDGLVLVAWHPVLPVGIDAERSDRAVDRALVDRVSTAAERAALAALPASSRSSGRLRLWVRKEAVAKADGRGLALPLAGIEVLGGQPLAVDAPAPQPLCVELRAGTKAAGEADLGAAGRAAGRAAGDVQVGGARSSWVGDLDVGVSHLAAVATIGGPARVTLQPWAGLRGG